MPVRQSISITLLTVAAALLLGGCGARHIRDAQDSFNAASQEEARVSDRGDAAYTSPAGISAYSAALGNYKIALSLVQKELAENRSELDKDNLTGTAITLRCLSLWRISDLEPPATGAGPPAADLPGDDAKACAINALKEKAVFGTRDRVVLVALPSFVDADRGRLATDYATARQRFADSYTGVQRAIGQAPADHDVTIYLHLVQLRTLRSWRSAIARMSGPRDDFSETDAKLKDEYCALAPRFALAPKLKVFVVEELAATGRSPPPATGPGACGT